MEGSLSKWTNVVQGWQYRWFVLDDNAGLLSYYTVSTDNALKNNLLPYFYTLLMNSLITFVHFTIMFTLNWWDSLDQSLNPVWEARFVSVSRYLGSKVLINFLQFIYKNDIYFLCLCIIIFFGHDLNTPDYKTDKTCKIPRKH